MQSYIVFRNKVWGSGFSFLGQTAPGNFNPGIRDFCFFLSFFFMPISHVYSLKTIQAAPEINSQTLPAIHEYRNLQDNQTIAIGNWADIPLLQFPRVIKACVCIPPVSVLHTLK